MATNKNQHFVPRCYLRPFTKDAEGAAINLYNVDRMRLISNAPVKNQCSRDYFYGRDEGLERAIQSVEGEYAKALSEILAPGFRVTEDSRQMLRVFWLMQYNRTETAARRATAWSAVASNTGSGTSSLRLEIKEAVRYGMLLFAGEMHAIDDVKICLLRNCSGIPFVTSDDPAVLTNRWNLTRGVQSFGIASAASLFLLPLSPEVLCLGYDGDVYSVIHKNGWVRVQRDSDVDAFNEHQFLNCRANIFVRDLEHGSYADGAFRRFAGNRLKERYPVNGETEAWHPTPTGWPSQIAWRSLGGCAYTNGTGTGYIRRAHLPREAQPAYRKIRIP